MKKILSVIILSTIMLLNVGCYKAENTSTADINMIDNTITSTDITSTLEDTSIESTSIVNTTADTVTNTEISGVIAGSIITTSVSSITTDNNISSNSGVKVEIKNNNENTQVTNTNISQTEEDTYYLSLAKAKLSEMTLREKVCQMFIVTPEALAEGYSCVTQAGDVIKQGLTEYPVGGIIYFSQNLETPEQTSTMIANSQEYIKEVNNGIGLFISVDEEGGLVSRLGSNSNFNVTDFENMSVYGAKGDLNVAYNIGETLAKDISSLGFNVDFAPVADVNINPNNPIGSRIFSSDANIVSNMTAQEVLGMQNNKVCAALKHFPGLGATSNDTHNSSAVVLDRTLEELKSTEFVAFQGGIDAGVEFVMVGHAIATGIGENVPSDLSAKVISLLRGLSFNGIIITDAQDGMTTITDNYTSGSASVQSIKAGIDIVLMPQNLEQSINSVLEAINSGEITEERINESVLRILKVKYEYEIIE